MARPRPGFKPSNGFKPGNCANPRGRGAGARDKYPRSLWQKLEARGDRDPIDFLSEVSSSALVDMPLRIQAAGMLASYKHGKRPSYRYIEDITNMPAPRTIAEAQQYLARLTFLVATGKLDVDGAAAVKDLLQAYIDSVIGSEVDQRLRVLEEMARDQATRGFAAAVIVESSMPRMPGTEGLIMPGDRPVTDQKPNPWGNVPDVGATVETAAEAAPKRRGRPRKRSKPEAGPEQPPDPKTDPEPS
jgi:hypothetical protein